MSQRRAGHIHRCPNCRVNYYFCVCSNLQPLQIKNTVSLVVHVSELKLTSNTAQFVHKLLPDAARIFIRGQVHHPFMAEEVLASSSGLPLFLYPDEEALELNQDFLKNFQGPFHLIVPDGNWNQAKKVKAREAHFRPLISVKIPDGLSGEYQLRKAPRPQFLSTFEAVARALGILEGPDVQWHMEKFFRIWVEATLKARSGDFAPKA
jgi:DTW domain-containing protein YfiP